jgi:hypothetical protein
MNDQDVRTYEMGVRVRDFHNQNAASFPSGSMGATLFATITSAVTRVANAMANQTGGSSDFHEGTMSKAAAGEAVRQSLERLRRTTRSMAQAEGNDHLDAKFRIPRKPSHQALLVTARASAAEAETMIDQLVAYGLPIDFPDTLNAQITALDTAISSQNTGLESQVAATREIEDSLEELITAVRQVNGIVHNVFHDNPAKLAAWETARHIERAPKKKKKAETPAGPTNPNP